MYSKDEWEIASYENFLYMQVKECIREMAMCDMSEYATETTKRKFDENINELEKINYQKNLIEEAKKEMEIYYGRKTKNRIMENN